jgi:hypothetical protein
MGTKIMVKTPNETADEDKIEIVDQMINVDQQDERPGFGYEVIGGD